MNKKSQITVFIIIGIILLFSVAIYLYFKNISVEKPAVAAYYVTPVEEFTTKCISGLAEEAIILAGQNGGYVYLPDQIARNPYAYIAATTYSPIKTALWYFNGRSIIPSEEYIAADIGKYIDNNIRLCTENYTSFNDYEITVLSNPKTTVSLNENDVFVKTEYKLKVVNIKNNTQTNIENFKATVPIRLKKAYELARDIMDAENRVTYFEDMTIDLISLDEDIPDTGFEFTCSQKTWQVQKVKKKLQRLLSVNIPYVRVGETSYTPFPNWAGQDSWDYEQNHYIWNVTQGKKNYKDLEVGFRYDEKWPFKFYARPSSNGIMKSNAMQGQQYLSWFCMHLWHFTYDAKYPVMVTIADNTNEQKPFIFNFGFEVSVNHNYPDRTNFAFTIMEPTDVENTEEYCSNARTEIGIMTKDNVTDEDIVGANLTFTCGRSSCYIGETDWLGYGAAAGIIKNFPYCTNGIVKATAENYEDSQIFVATGFPKTKTIYMNPVKKFDFEVVKHLTPDPTNPLMYSNEIPLARDESALIMIKLKDTKNERYATYPVPELDGEKQLLELYAKKDFIYNIEIYLVKGDKIIGGYSGIWTAPWSVLENSNKIKFHVVQKTPEIGDDEEGYAFIAGLSSYSNYVSLPEGVQGE